MAQQHRGGHRCGSKAGVHPAIVAGRWRFEYSDYRRFSKLIGRAEVKSVLKSA